LGTIKLPSTGSDGDMPDIAVSTGGADSLECLLTRIGIASSEYVAGWSGSGHVHIFNGGDPNAGGGGSSVGGPEANVMPGAPASDTGLWGSVADLMKNDVVLLSCEGGETYDAQPANLSSYLDSGGRVFASHFHYAWFTGSSGPPSYSSPAEWGSGGSDLAKWTRSGGTSSATVGGEVVTTLTNGGGTYAKGVAMKSWLGAAGALSTSIGGTTVSSPELPIVVPRYNASVTTQAPSQEWIHLDPKTETAGTSATTMYFSFDTPIDAPAKANGGTPQYCGRAVFSGLHVGGASYDGVNCSAGTHTGGGGSGDCNTNHVAPAPPPTGCDTGHPLSPQEKALEFMLFDLSACVIPENVPPTTGDGGVYIPK
jgi:hypothetical protein